MGLTPLAQELISMLTSVHKFATQHTDIIDVAQAQMFADDVVFYNCIHV